MIRFQLQCAADHQFESWFNSNAAYDQLAARHLVQCPHCGSHNVEKAIMAPNVGTKGNRRQDVAPVRAANGDAAEAAPTFADFRAMMRRVRAEVEARAENVGQRFAEEARKIHYAEAEPRGIYGEATPDEARALHEEGIEFHPLPRFPEEQH